MREACLSRATISCVRTLLGEGSSLSLRIVDGRYAARKRDRERRVRDGGEDPHDPATLRSRAAIVRDRVPRSGRLGHTRTTRRTDSFAPRA